MQFEFSVNSLGEISTDVILVFALQDKKEIKFLTDLKSFDKKLQASLVKAIKTAGFKAKRGETLSFYLEEASLGKSIIILGLGEETEFIADDLRRACGLLSTKIKGKVFSIALQIQIGRASCRERV